METPEPPDADQPSIPITTHLVWILPIRTNRRSLSSLPFFNNPFRSGDGQPHYRRIEPPFSFPRLSSDRDALAAEVCRAADGLLGYPSPPARSCPWAEKSPPGIRTGDAFDSVILGLRPLRICACGAVEDFGFEDLRFQTDPQSGANSAPVVAHEVAEAVDAAAAVDVGRVVGIQAGRPQPPQAGGFAAC